MKLFIATMFVFSISCLSAQNFIGEAIYKTHTKLELEKDSASSENSEASALKKQIRELMQKGMQKTFVLKFSNEASTYQESKALDVPKPSVNGISITVKNSSDVVYKNFKTKQYTNEVDLFGKPFLVTDSLETYNWTLEKETKNIGQYVCFKATTTKKIASKDSDSIPTTSKEKTITAWYTPQINVSNGPEKFHGLPGLILELNDGKTTIVCSKITLTPNSTELIKKPTKGKEVTQKEFDLIQEKKLKQMQDLYGDGDGNIIFMH